ncbi:MAG: phosphonate dehydrogenase [Pseudorhizobium sp.]
MTRSLNQSTSRHRIVVTNKIHDEIARLLGGYAEVVLNTAEEPWPRERLVRELVGATAVMTFMPDRIDREFLNAAPDLAVVSCALKGYDNFDVATCTERGIWVSIVQDLLTQPTADLTIGLMIGLARHVLAGDAHVRTGFAGWRPRFYGTGLSGSRVGILGMGAIGCELAKRLSGFNCEIFYWDHNLLTPEEERRLGVSASDFQELVSTSQFLVSALPLNPETHHLVGACALAAMRPDALLINPSRGGVVDESAVADALETDRLAGYAADVFEMEDWAIADRPRQIEPRLIAMRDRTLLTPHIGSAVRDVRLAIEREAALNIIDVIEGRPPRSALNDIRVDAT